MTKLTFHRLIFILIFGIIYSMIHVFGKLDIRSMTIAVWFSVISLTAWDFIFYKQPEWKDKYKD